MVNKHFVNELRFDVMVNELYINEVLVNETALGDGR